MKQNLLPARLTQLRIPFVIFVLALIPSACVVQTQQVRYASSVSHSHPEASKAERGSLININTATPQELEKLPGVGKVVAERIVSHRRQYGTFRRVEHLMMVRGISDRKFRALRRLLTVVDLPENPGKPR